MSTVAVYRTINTNNDFGLTRHGWERMSGRGFSPEAVRKVLSFGRVTHVRGAIIYAIGRKEIAHFKKDGVDLDDLNGLQIICNENDVVITMYRNRDFRGLRPRRRSRRGQSRRR